MCRAIAWSVFSSQPTLRTVEAHRISVSLSVNNWSSHFLEVGHLVENKAYGANLGLYAGFAARTPLSTSSCASGGYLAS